MTPFATGFDVHTPAAALVAGVVLLLFGRRLYWLFVGAAGFVAGVVFAERFAEQPPLVVLAIAIIAGVVGALLALWLQRAMVAVAGFGVGGAVAASLFSGADPQTAWLPFIVGGIVGALLVLLLLDWALVVLSSLAGAALVAQTLRGERTLEAAAFVAAAVLGIVVQSLQLRRPPSL